MPPVPTSQDLIQVKIWILKLDSQSRNIVTHKINFPIYICILVKASLSPMHIFTQPLRLDTKSILKWSLTGFNLEFSCCKWVHAFPKGTRAKLEQNYSGFDTINTVCYNKSFIEISMWFFFYQFFIHLFILSAQTWPRINWLKSMHTWIVWSIFYREVSADLFYSLI